MSYSNLDVFKAGVARDILTLAKDASDKLNSEDPHFDRQMILEDLIGFLQDLAHGLDHRIEPNPYPTHYSIGDAS